MKDKLKCYENLKTQNFDTVKRLSFFCFMVQSKCLFVVLLSLFLIKVSMLNVLWLAILISIISWSFWVAISFFRYKMYYNDEKKIWFALISLLPSLIVSVIYISIFFHSDTKSEELITQFVFLYFLSLLYNGLLNGLIDNKIRKYRKIQKNVQKLL
ncbi:MAG: hypothetical protein LBU60_02920 [Clostridiales bacterium]|jgi:hypothetical protein|nr:hypothetical protein [Clostridiales bacterium]